MKAFISAFNLAMVGIGDLFAGVIYNIVSSYLSRPHMLFLFAGFMAINLVIFAFFASRYKFKSYSYDSVRTGTEGTEMEGLVPKTSAAGLLPENVESLDHAPTDKSGVA